MPRPGVPRIHALVWPGAGVVPRTLERIQTVDVRYPFRGGEATDGANHELGRDTIPIIVICQRVLPSSYLRRGHAC